MTHNDKVTWMLNVDKEREKEEVVKMAEYNKVIENISEAEENKIKCVNNEVHARRPRMSSFLGSLFFLCCPDLI